MQNQCLLPLLRIEIGIPRAHGQPIHLAHNRTSRNLHRQIQISHHAPDDRHLRRILLPEERNIGLDHMKQLRHNRGDTAKVSRPRTPVQLPAKLLHRNPGDRARRLPGAPADGTHSITMCAPCRMPPTIPLLRRIVTESCSDPLIPFSPTATTRPYGHADAGNCASRSSTSSGFSTISALSAGSSNPTPSVRMTR